MSDALKRFLRALEDGGKIDRYNEKYYKALLAENDLTITQIKALPPVVPWSYDPKYKVDLLALLEWEFQSISIANIKAVAESNAYYVEATRLALRQYPQTMKHPRPRAPLPVPSKYSESPLMEYYRELAETRARENPVLLPAGPAPSRSVLLPTGPVETTGRQRIVEWLESVSLDAPPAYGSW
jgi:hypothetical protein